jgi:outer membrane protein OmpA-like peptidoglycan-associated protein/Tol biopolymer transport system component
MRKIIFTLYIITVLSNLFSYAQNHKYLDKTYDYAELCFKNGDYSHARKYIDLILEDDSSYFKAYKLLGEYFLTFEYYDSLIIYYQQCSKFCGKKYPETYYQLANFQFYMGLVNEALESYRLFLSKVPKSNITNRVNEQIKRCEYSLSLINNPVDFNPVNLGEGVNSVCNDYYPYISPDEATIVFTRRVPLYKSAPPESVKTQEDFYISYFSNGEWTTAVPLPGDVNTKMNEGAQTITGDGKYMVFTACNRPDGKGQCDLYFSQKTAQGWTKAKNLKEINSMDWESQPSISADGKELYFVSERASGIGNSDIYVSYRKENGSWGTPVLLDTTINTAMSEVSPFIHPDGHTLYFCSNGHFGVGGYDIFMSKRNSDGKWSKPINLGYPINTTKDEIGLVVAASGKKAYITSSRQGGFGLNDIYAFDLPKKFQADDVTYVKGKIFDKVSHKSINAHCEIIDLTKNQVIISTDADSVDGEFLLCLPKGKEYGLFISSDGYLFHSENINLVNNQDINVKIKDIEMLPAVNGASIVLPNVFFATDSFKLKSNSFAELEKVVRFMTVNSKIKIEISGHTDNKGNENHNKVLSEKRAKAIFDYLVAKGITSSRMTYAGYASTKPIANNDSEEGRALNRRTEIKIIQ